MIKDSSKHAQACIHAFKQIILLTKAEKVEFWYANDELRKSIARRLILPMSDDECSKLEDDQINRRENNLDGIIFDGKPIPEESEVATMIDTQKLLPYIEYSLQLSDESFFALFSYPNFKDDFLKDIFLGMTTNDVESFFAEIFKLQMDKYIEEHKDELDTSMP